MSSILPFGLFLILIMITPFSISFASASEPLTIITEEWPPFNYTENDVLKGFSTSSQGPCFFLLFLRLRESLNING